MFEKQRQEWEEMDPKWKLVLICLVVSGSVGIFFFDRHQTALQEAQKTAHLNSSGSPTQSAAGVPAGTRYDAPLLPPSNRNQGLEDVLIQLRLMREELNQYKLHAGLPVAPDTGIQAGPASTIPANATSSTTRIPRADGVDLNAVIPPPPMALPPPVNFEPVPAPGHATAAGAAGKPAGSETAGDKPAEAAAPTPRVLQPVRMDSTKTETAARLLIPVNTGLEAVLLSGVAARPSGATSGALGSALSANSVGAPFVSRLKGDAILPNGWKVSDLGDCFLGGSAVAVLSAERAYAIADALSCVAANGDVYEGPVKAYGLDVDGTLGLAGKVVSKQGAILFQALLTGIASGLGTALTPTPIAGFNSAAANGSAQGVQYPDADAIARTAVGAGIGNATAQLSRFYLEFARETFPVIEVVAGTRITWVLKESIELQRSRSAKP